MVYQELLYIHIMSLLNVPLMAHSVILPLYISIFLMLHYQDSSKHGECTLYHATTEVYCLQGAPSICIDLSTNQKIKKPHYQELYLNVYLRSPFSKYIGCFFEYESM